MDGANADSDHSMTWEDFFGSTTDLTPTLIGIYDSLLEPAKKTEISRFNLTATDTRNEPPLNKTTEVNNKEIKPENMKGKEEPIKLAPSVKPTVNINKSTLYTLRTKVESESVSEVKKTETNAFDNLSPNVKRMISSATDSTALKFQKKCVTGARVSIRGHRSNIPLIGATSKISQSGVEILPSVEIYDQPSVAKNSNKDKESQSQIQKLKPNFKLETQETYDVPTNNKPAFDATKTAFESLSLPYIDQSIELSISTDREFDPKIASKEMSPKKDETSSPPSKIPKTGTNSLHRNEFGSRNGSPAKQLAKFEQYPEAIGSTGNLSKEVTRLNPPTVEVSRPLSMSSIASSSSTSSSGVQNKGGVNSAYLASIESLDDHSDADMISAGINNFVNNSGMNKSVSEERRSESLPRDQYEAMSGLSQLERVCAEIVHTENTYVQDLEQVVEGYLHVWRREVTFSEEELSELFNNIEDIYNFNKSLCAELNSCRLDETCIARCFVNNTSGFSVYTSYCTGYPRTMERLAALASSPESAREFRERQVALGHPLPLASYLLKPVQRILKYHLLLQNVVKQCASRETEYALLKMTGIAQHIDDMKRRHEHAVRVQEIQSLLYGWNGPDLTTYGELCAEGTFRVFGAKAMRHAFLFDKMLLITKNREDGILAYKSHIMCNNMMLVESIAGAPLSFHVIPWDAPRAQLTLAASSPRHKREWTLLLKRVILENYNAVIPSHARQLVMELGQNKTDDDMLAEKSHNLITQASMRKQLSAPEYLEKRKLDRERRKSFENNPRARPKKINRKHTTTIALKEVKCDCAQVSIDKGIEYTCEICYVDLCYDCDVELKKKDLCNCNDVGNKCPECDRSLHYIDAGSAEHLERKLSTCKCSDFKSSQESFNKDYISPLNKTRGYHSSDNIVGYTDTKSKEDLTDINNSMTNVRNMPKSCLKCVKIKENIVVTESTDTLRPRKSRCQESDKHSIRSKSKDDPHRVKLSKIGTWRRKSEPGLQQNNVTIPKKPQDANSEKNDNGFEKIEFECRNCGSNKINGKGKNNTLILSDPEMECKRSGAGIKSNVEIKMYNTTKVPKKISKLKKNRAKGMRLGSDTTAKFYADLSTDVSVENILHITESTDSLNVENVAPSTLPEIIIKDESIDEETYKKLIEKTDSFKKNELEKGKFLNKQKVINEGSEDETDNVEIRPEEVTESCEETEQPLEQIISQLLLQNREFQKLLKKQQLRNTAHRRHQRLLKSHSNPEQPNPPKSIDSLKLKPKFGRQTSECVETNSNGHEIKILSPPNEDDDDDHIYETLRVENKIDESLHSLNNKSKSIQHNTRIARPKRLPSPPDPNKNNLNMMNPESDYVYLSFDKLDKIEDNEGIYDVPVKTPEKVTDKSKAPDDYYVTVEGKCSLVKPEEDTYDNIIEVCRRKKEPPSSIPGEYLPMSPDHSPNTPEIWLNRQKEHFNVSRDRKSGSLPRSFQVVSATQEEPNMTTFKSKSSNSKTYLNKDGKVMNNERPFTIASDQSEISFDDVETYMNEGDILKFNKANYNPENETTQNISKSTLELEEEIDRCYKNNFESIKLDASKNEKLNASIPNLDTSTTSSCEVLSTDKKDIHIIHPEHKIYKPTSNILSLKNVLSRFKTRKSNDDADFASNDTLESGKTDLKSPTSEKRSALNPRSYSKNLLQRFRSIIGDETPDDHQHKSEKSKKSDEANLIKSEIKVVVTSTDASPTASAILSSDALSKSVYEQTTLTESQNEKNNLDILSHSCDNITKADTKRPNYDKSVSMVTTVSSSVSSITSPSKSISNSFQSLNKLPIYMQGSKCLGARIAQSDYVDPSTLKQEKGSMKNVNILINKSAVRPDSLFSNSSFVTSSSEGTFKEIQRENTTEAMETVVEAKSPESGATISDDNFYEKSFEKIEQITDDDVFRDSAVYSDQEDTEDSKTESSGRGKTVTKSFKQVDTVQRNSSLKTEKFTVTANVTELKTVSHTKVTVVSKAQVLSKTELKPQINKPKPKLAPPVPVKPKLTNIPTANLFQHRNITKTTSLTNTEERSSIESENTKTIKRNTNIKQSFIRSESTPQERVKEGEATNKEAKNTDDSTDGKLKADEKPKQSNIQIKRLSFERASLDSATRKLRNNISETKRSSIEAPKSTSKSVMERRMEIESLTKTQAKINQIRKPSQLAKPKTFTQKPEMNAKSKVNTEPQTKSNIPITEPNVEEKPDDPEAKGSWVKTVVNKFQ